VALAFSSPYDVRWYFLQPCPRAPPAQLLLVAGLVVLAVPELALNLPSAAASPRPPYGGASGSPPQARSVFTWMCSVASSVVMGSSLVTSSTVTVTSS